MYVCMYVKFYGKFNGEHGKAINKSYAIGPVERRSHGHA